MERSNQGIRGKGSEIESSETKLGEAYLKPVQSHQISTQTMVKRGNILYTWRNRGEIISKVLNPNHMPKSPQQAMMDLVEKTKVEGREEGKFNLTIREAQIERKFRLVAWEGTMFYSGKQC